MQEHIIVTGGNGFVGREICKLLNAKGWPVVSISRKGMPASINANDYPLVTWASADVFNTETWDRYTDNCFAIIHCIGIIDEVPELGVTFEKYIFQSAKIVGDLAKKLGINTLVFISAAAGAPDTPPAYMENKVAAEQYLNSLGIGTVILKPGLIYGLDKPETMQEHEHMLDLMKDPNLRDFIHPNRPLSVETIARVAVAAGLGQIRDNVLNVDGIEAADMLLKARDN